MQKDRKIKQDKIFPAHRAGERMKNIYVHHWHLISVITKLHKIEENLSLNSSSALVYGEGFTDLKCVSKTVNSLMIHMLYH